MSVVRLAGPVVAFSAGLLLSRTESMWATAPVVAGTILLAVLVTELSRPRPERQRGTGAALEVRRVRDYVPRGAALGGLALAVLLLAEMWLLTQFDDYGYMRYEPWNLDWTVAFASWADTARVAGGIKGTVLVTLVALLLCPAAVWSTVRSPRAGADDSTRERDERWRRGVVQTFVASGGWVVSSLVIIWNTTLVFLSPAIGPTTSVNDASVAAAAALFATAGLTGVTVYGSALLRAPTG